VVILDEQTKKHLEEAKQSLKERLNELSKIITESKQQQKQVGKELKKIEKVLG
jgi:F0F1-type ATP synthase membrane subunit b/b'